MKNMKYHQVCIANDKYILYLKVLVIIFQQCCLQQLKNYFRSYYDFKKFQTIPLIKLEPVAILLLGVLTW